ncbi:MAG: DUF4105 domain-containing protein [Bacteroidaceae bacterium]|nr:DUF4105 domain-containing protein [Bacteroidaceae bacterium]
MRRFLAFFIAFVAIFTVCAQQLDSIRISLLTCSPGPKVYSLYGHTAIRCQNLNRGEDIVFNYGVFSFDQPHFVWRFVLGQCDYMVDAMPWKAFVREYKNRGSSVTGQVLNLTSQEAFALFVLLVGNLQPDQREYRYNFLYNNCTTKVRDVIERVVEGHIEYPHLEPRNTYRQILHKYTANYPWAQEGNDFLLGENVDTVLSARAEMFAPEYLMNYMAGAVVRVSKTEVRPLVSETEMLVNKSGHPSPSDSYPSPLIACGAFLLFCLFVMLMERWLKFMWWGWDVLLMSAHGIAGMLITFMFFFSEHPAVNSNWLIWIFNPYPLVGLPIVIKAARKHQYTPWHVINFVILTLFILFSPWIPQDFGDMVVPLALSLLTRPISYLLHYRVRGCAKDVQVAVSMKQVNKKRGKKNK